MHLSSRFLTSRRLADIQRPSTRSRMPAVGQPRPGFDPYRIRLRRRAYRSTSALAGTHHWHCGRIVRIRDPFSGRRRNLHPHHSAPRRFGFRAGSPPCFRRPKPFNQNHPRHHTSSPGFRRSPPIQSFQNLRRQPDMQNQVHQRVGLCGWPRSPVILRQGGTPRDPEGFRVSLFSRLDCRTRCSTCHHPGGAHGPTLCTRLYTPVHEWSSG